MKQTTKSPGEEIVKDIKKANSKHYSPEETIRVALQTGLADLTHQVQLSCAICVRRQGFWGQ